MSRKPTQQSMFSQGEDLPLFSGTAQTVTVDAFKPQPVQLLKQLDMFNPAHEFKATATEKAEAQIVAAHLASLPSMSGLTATYAGGKKSKGQGFWVSGRGYLSCADCLQIT